jgi:Fic family protein
MLLARAESSGERFYSMSSQILVERKRYYKVLQKSNTAQATSQNGLNGFYIV